MSQGGYTEKSQRARRSTAVLQPRGSRLFKGYTAPDGARAVLIF